MVAAIRAISLENLVSEMVTSEAAWKAAVYYITSVMKIKVR